MPRIRKDLGHLRIAKNYINKDALEIEDGEDIFLVSKEEANLVIDTYISQKVIEWFDKITEYKEKHFKEVAHKRLVNMEERAIIFIESRFDKIAESIVERLITKKFNEEIEARVAKKLREKGKF